MTNACCGFPTAAFPRDRQGSSVAAEAVPSPPMAQDCGVSAAAAIRMGITTEEPRTVNAGAAA